MSGHTPGPWTVDEFYEPGGFYKIRSESEVVCHTHSFAPRGCDDEATGNANLIAASPDLLEACRGILAMHEGPPNAVGNWDIAFDEIRAAIAKAEGR